MTSRLLVAGIAAGCITAAGVGGYLAVRTASYSSEPTVAAAPAEAPEPLPVVADPFPVEPPAPAALTDGPRPSVPPQEPPRASRPSARTPRTAAPTALPVAEVTSAETATPPVTEVASSPETLPELEVPTTAEAIPMHPGRAIALPEPVDELVELPANAVIGIRLDTTVSSESARVEDAVRARVTRPVIVDGVTVIPTGTRLNGVVSEVETGGRFRERARIGVRFTSLTLDNNRNVPIQTETIYREGEPPAGEATAKIGASAVVGSILGGVIGGRKGAAIGAATGAAGGTAVVASGGRNAAVLLSGSTFTLRLSEPATIHIDR